MVICGSSLICAYGGNAAFAASLTAKIQGLAAKAAEKPLGAVSRAASKNDGTTSGSDGSASGSELKAFVARNENQVDGLNGRKPIPIVKANVSSNSQGKKEPGYDAIPLALEAASPTGIGLSDLRAAMNYQVGRGSDTAPRTFRAENLPTEGGKGGK